MNYFYARVSSESLTFENQLLEFSKYAKFRSLNIDKIVKDISDGFENKRGNCLFDLLNQMKENDTLYCYNLSRISRRASKLLLFYDLIKERHVKVFFLINSNEDAIIKEAPIELSVILSNISEIDAEYISIVTKNALNGLKEKGIKLGRPKKYDSEITKKVIELYNSGKNCTKIAKELNIGHVTVWRMVNCSDEAMIKEETFIDIPLETKLEIWGDKKVGKTNKELAELYKLDVETIEYVLKSLKGGAHW